MGRQRRDRYKMDICVRKEKWWWFQKPSYLPTAYTLTAFAPVSAALYSGSNPTNCTPGRAVPIITICGLADNIVDFYKQNGDKEVHIYM